MPLADDLIVLVGDAINTTINKFRENPFYFFTESDIHSYFYHVLYSSRFEIVHGTKRIYLVHREYPTNFRYSKDALLLDNYTAPYALADREGDRGNYDIAVINPNFVSTARSIDDVVNKNVRLLEERVSGDLGAVKKELLFAIEFKYAIHNSVKFVSEVLQDNKKLLFGTQWGAAKAVNLVFCNFDGSYVEQMREAVRNASSEVLSVFVQCYHKGTKKMTPSPITNHGDDGVRQFIGVPLPA